MTILAADVEPVIVDDRETGIRIKARREPRRAVIELLSKLSFGSEGLEYRRLDIAAQLARLPSPVFIELEQDGRLVGTYMVATTTLQTDAGRVTGLYRGLLGLEPGARERGLGKTLVASTLDWIDRYARQHAEPLISWGCIEAANRRSLGLLGSLGADRLAELEALTVFRQWPRRRVRAGQLATSEAGTIAVGLADSYADCAVCIEPLSASDYWAVTDDSGIVAGARAALTRVDMHRTGSAWDAAWRGLLRFVPAARRRFDPRNFRYLRLSDVIVRDGAAEVWRELLPTLLREHDAYLAMFVVDPRCDARRRLETPGLFGRLTASTRQRIAVMAHTWQLDDMLRAELGRRPLAIGPLDL